LLLGLLLLAFGSAKYASVKKGNRGVAFCDEYTGNKNVQSDNYRITLNRIIIRNLTRDQIGKQFSTIYGIIQLLNEESVNGV
jgi:hypothetical protein